MSAVTSRNPMLSTHLTLLRSIAILMTLLLTIGNAAAQGTTYLQPSISSFSPTSGMPGTTVAVYGSNFSQTSVVRIGGVSVPFSIVSNTRLNLTVAKNTSTGVIRVANPGYTAASTSSLVVTAAVTQNYPQPSLGPHSPVSGPVGTVVTITGSGFTGATAVWLGNDRNLPFTVISDSEVRATVTAASTTSGFGVLNPAHGGFSPLKFTITAGSSPALTPTISSFSPATGPVGTVVTITGNNFAGATGVTVGTSSQAAVSSVTATSLSFVVPANASSGSVRVYNTSTSGASAANFTVTVPAPVPVPAVSSFTPTSGPIGTVITVTGSGFSGTTEASIGNSTRVAVSNVTATSLSFTVPAGTASGVIQVFNASYNGSSTSNFTVTVPAAVPTISNFSPTSGPVGTVVSVTGTGFTGVNSVSVGGVAASSISVASSTSLSFVVPNGAVSGTLRIANPTNSTTSSSNFTVTVPAAVPTISSFSPTSGPVGTVVSVTGTGFTGANSVSVGGVAASSISVASSTSLSFVVPNGAVSGTLRIANPTNSTTSSTAYTVVVVTTPPTGTMGQAAAARLLTQASFGPTLASLDSAASQSYDAWFAAQAATSPSLLLPSVPNNNTAWTPLWWRNVITGQDQLRQRMAFALSEIFVVSDQSGAIIHQNQSLASYYDLLTTNGLGNFRTLLERVTLSPTMGLYLNMFRSNKEDPVTGVHADQNYAREVMQLFTIGLVKLNLDGSAQTDAAGVPIPTYTQNDVKGMADTLTGWASSPVNSSGEGAWTYDIDYVKPMVAYENHHDNRAKTIVGGVTVPAGGTAAQDMKIALDTLFNHPNTGPFISLRLIQRLVTSNPSPAYIARVASVFNNNGSGVRGDLLAVAKAILTDPEAVVPGDNTAGKIREPLIRVANLWRAFSASDSAGNVADYGLLLYSTEYFAQSVLSSPSVFNFFAPDYQRSGQLAFAGLLAPEFQITNENTLVLTANLLQRMTYQYVDSKGVRNAGPNGYSEAGSLAANNVLLKTAAWEGYAANATTLVDRLNTVFMQGLMSAAMRTTLINYVNAIPASAPASRVIEATDLLINSPQFAIQR